MQETLVTKTLPQDPTIEVLVPNYKEPILPVNHGGFGWYGLQAYNQEGQLMCHECGTFWDSLGRHVEGHGLSGREYKIRYGLRMRNSLVSTRGHEKARLATMKGAGYQAHLANLRSNAKRNGAKSAGTRCQTLAPLEVLNAHDSCPQQILRRLIEASEVYGASVTKSQCNAFDSRLFPQIERMYGSFNKGKQLVKLVTTAVGDATQFTKIIILEDMCAFFSKYGRWPTKPDYTAHLMLCSFRTVGKQGGIRSLRREAMKLKQTQDATAQQAEQIPAYADSIERELAGAARV